MSIEILYLSLKRKTVSQLELNLKASSDGEVRLLLSAQQQRQYELHYFIFAARYHITNKPCDIDKSVIFSCAKNIPVMLERNCPTLSQTSSMKLSCKGILHFHNTDSIKRIL